MVNGLIAVQVTAHVLNTTHVPLSKAPNTQTALGCVHACPCVCVCVCMYVQNHVCAACKKLNFLQGINEVRLLLSRVLT